MDLSITAEEAEAPPADCQMCAAPLRLGSVYCSRCGHEAALRSSERPCCWRCDKTLRKRALYCTCCGAKPNERKKPKGEQKQKQKQKRGGTCWSCSAGLRTGQLFCTKCGAKESDRPADVEDVSDGGVDTGLDIDVDEDVDVEVDVESGVAPQTSSKTPQKSQSAPVVADAPPAVKDPCTNCGKAMIPGAPFCLKCGTPRPKTEKLKPRSTPKEEKSKEEQPEGGCWKCHKPLIPGAPFCFHCSATTKKKEISKSANVISLNPRKSEGIKHRRGSVNKGSRFPCPHCAKMLKFGSPFCNGCGGKIEGAATSTPSGKRKKKKKKIRCVKCKASIPGDTTFCKKCGAKQVDAANAVLEALDPSMMAGEDLALLKEADQSRKSEVDRIQAEEKRLKREKQRQIKQLKQSSTAEEGAEAATFDAYAKQMDEHIGELVETDMVNLEAGVEALELELMEAIRLAQEKSESEAGDAATAEIGAEPVVAEVVAVEPTSEMEAPDEQVEATETTEPEVAPSPEIRNVDITKFGLKSFDSLFDFSDEEEEDDVVTLSAQTLINQSETSLALFGKRDDQADEYNAMDIDLDAELDQLFEAGNLDDLLIGEDDEDLAFLTKSARVVDKGTRSEREREIEEMMAAQELLQQKGLT